MILGESLTKNIVLLNKGALNAPFTIRQMKAQPRPDVRARYFCPDPEIRCKLES